eukprot:Platyproteum_vivax@DN7524_c0_g1_i8.p1
MKLFSAVVLSLLFCFVKSFKSRAIRGHLKNVSAHGQAMRVRAGSDSEVRSGIKKLAADLEELQEKVDGITANTDLDDLDTMWSALTWNLLYAGSLTHTEEGIKSMEESDEKTQLSNQLEASNEKIKKLTIEIDEKRRPKYREELEELEKEVDTWKVGSNKNKDAKDWSEVLQKLHVMIQSAKDGDLPKNDEWETFLDKARQVRADVNQLDE